MSRLLALGTAFLLIVGFCAMPLTAQEGKQDAEKTKKTTEAKAKKTAIAKKDATQEKEEPAATKKPIAKKAATKKADNDGEDADVGKSAPAPKKAVATTKKASGAVSAADADAIRKSTRLPAYYGQIDLSPDQRQKVIDLYAEYRIQTKPHRDQIAELEAQIAKLREDFEKTASSVLTAGQRTKLEQARSKRSGGEEDDDAKKSK